MASVAYGTPATAAILLLVCSASARAGVRYDQTQTGDYNVHLDLKNIEVLAFLDGGALGINDYDYDYNDYTLKPPSNSSVAPSGGFGGGPNATAPASGNSSSTPQKPGGGGRPGAARPPGNETAEAQQGVRLEAAESSTEQASETSTKPVRRCGAGFYRDPAGRCRRLRRPIKLSGLLQKATNRISGY